MLLALLLVLAGCGRDVSPTPLPSPDSASATSAAVRAQGTQAVLDQITGAAAAEDQRRFRDAVSERDPSFAGRAQMIFANLTSMPLTALRMTAGPRVEALSAERRAVLGSDSWVQEVTISWQLAADPSPAQHTVWVTMVVTGDHEQLAGITDGPGNAKQADPLPLWWLEPVRVGRAGTAITLVSDGPDTGQGWARAADHAAAKVRARVGATAPDWSGRLVVEVPGSREAFDQVLGARPGTYQQIAAVTRADGANLGAAPIRIVINPSATGTLSNLGLSVLLAHEATHVATHSVDSPAPSWALEGFADYVAYTAYPAAGRAGALNTRVRARHIPRHLPSDETFRGTSDGLDLAYTEAWLACRYVADEYSPEALNRLYRQLDQGRSLDQASRSVLGISADRFTAEWRRYVSALPG
jgi:hypothetical protein